MPPRSAASAARHRGSRLLGAVLLIVGCTSLCPAPVGAAVGDITTVAGTGSPVESGDGGPATNAGTAGPAGLALDGAGNLYVADSSGHTVRRITPTGGITTVAGTGAVGAEGDGGPATAATLVTPADVALDGSGNLFIADYGAHTIRKVTPDGTISTIAGTAGVAGFTVDGGPAAGSLLNQPAGLDTDAGGNLYVADFGNHAVRLITTAGRISTVAGGRRGSTGDGGPATSARLRNPADVSLATDGTYYIADYGNHLIRKVTPAGIISTVAGTGVAGYTGDGGPATAATLAGPTGIEVDSVGSLFIAEYLNHTIRKVTPTGGISTVAGRGGVPGFAGDGGAATAALLNTPARVVLDRKGDFFIADLANNRVRRVLGLGLPDPPILDTATSPASPSNENTFLVTGSAPPGSVVHLYDDPDCTSIVASASAEELTSSGVEVTVASDTVVTLHATLTGTDGRTSGCSTSSVTYTEDSTAPVPPVLTAWPGSPSGATTAAWSFTVAEGDATCVLTGPDGEPFAGPAPCGGAVTSYDLSSGADGTYLFSVDVVDAAGNRSAPTSATYELDREAPLPPVITSQPSSPSKLDSVTWSFHAAEGAPSCTLTDPRGESVPGGADCASGTAAYDLTGRPDGSYTFSVLTTDGAGNASAAPTTIHERDTTPPAAPRAVEVVPSPSSSRDPKWTVEAEEGELACTLTAPDGEAIPPVAPCVAGEAAFDLTGRPDGTYVLSVITTDAAGNSSDDWTDLYVLDTIAPSPPTIVAGPPREGAGRLVEWRYETVEGVVTCELIDPDGEAVEPSTCTASRATFDLGGRPDGDYAFIVTATDHAQNVSGDAEGTYGLDTAPPPPPVITEGPASPGAGRDVRWTFDAAGSPTCALVGPGGEAIAPTSCGGGEATFVLPEGAGDGNYTFSVTASDPAGNVSTAAVGGYLLDTAAPEAPVVTRRPASPDDDRTVSWAYDIAEGTARCLLRAPDGSTVTSGSCGAGGAGYDLMGLEDGEYLFTVTAVDDAGNSAAAAPERYVLDSIPPPAPTLTSTPVTPGVPRRVEWRFTTEDGVASCELIGPGGAEVAGGAACATGTAVYDLSEESAGTYSFRVWAVDPAGNRSTATRSDIVVTTPPPPSTTTTSTTTTSTTAPPPSTTTTSTTTTSTTAPPPSTTTTSTTTTTTSTTTTSTTPPPAAVTTTTAPPPVGVTTTTVSPVTGPAADVAPLASPAPVAVTAPRSRAAATTPTTARPRPSLSLEPLALAPDDEERHDPQPVPAVTAGPSPRPTTTLPPIRRADVPRVADAGGAPERASDPGMTFPMVRIVGAVAEKSTIPMSLLLVVVVFLLVQDRMDRNDPKLALAPVYPDPELPFGPRPRPATPDPNAGGR